MSCPACGLGNQVELSAEMIIHLMGPQNVDSPGVWVFPKLLVCLDCGFSGFNVLEPELGLLAGRPPAGERLARAAG